MKKNILRILLIILILVPVYLTYKQHYMTVRMSPFIFEVYDNIDNLPRRQARTLDATAIAKKHFQIGMSSKQARRVIEASTMKFGKEGHTGFRRKKLYDESIIAGKLIPGGYGGIYKYLYGYYDIVIILDFNDDKLEQIESVVHLRSL